ncbi:uncharacterized protein ACIBXB_014184 [Morphnus guianensis]
MRPPRGQPPPGPGQPLRAGGEAGQPQRPPPPHPSRESPPPAPGPRPIPAAAAQLSRPGTRTRSPAAGPALRGEAGPVRAARHGPGPGPGPAPLRRPQRAAPRARGAPLRVAGRALPGARRARASAAAPPPPPTPEGKPEAPRPFPFPPPTPPATGGSARTFRPADGSRPRGGRDEAASPPRAPRCCLPARPRGLMARCPAGGCTASPGLPSSGGLALGWALPAQKGPAAFTTSAMTPPRKACRAQSQHTQELCPWFQGLHYQPRCTRISLTES